MFKTILLVLIVAMINWPQEASSCSCEPPNFRAQFCRSTYAAVINVQQPRPRDDDGIYSAYGFATRSVIRMGDKHAENAFRSQLLFVRRRRNSCTAELRPGGQYVIFGQPSTDGRLVATACNTIPMELLTEEERNQLELYAKNGVPCR